MNNLGTVYYAKKSYRRAMNQYKKALRINPQSASVWSNLGMGYFARKDYVRAADALQKALMLDPEVFESRNTQGVLLQERSVEEHAKFHYYLARNMRKRERTIARCSISGRPWKRATRKRRRFRKIRRLRP